MSNPWWIASATGIGLAVASLSHCALMCGPVAAHAGASRGAFRYLVGRFASYTLLGTIAGSVGEALGELGPARWIEAFMSWSIAIALALAAARLLAPAQSHPGLVPMGKKGKPGLASRALSSVASDSLLLGLASALLPCGVLYTALLAAAAQQSAAAGALTMATFNLVSGAALLGVAQLARGFSLRMEGRRALGVLLAAGAVLLVLRPLPSLSAEELPPCHRAQAEARSR